MFFHIYISWKFINSSTFNVCGRLCLVFYLLHLWKNTWCSSTFLYNESILILPWLMFVKRYVQSSTFHIYFLLKYMCSSTFNIGGRLRLVFPLLHLSKNTWCSSIFFSWKYMNSSTFNLCQKLCEVFHLPHLWKNIWYFSTFLFFGSIFILPLNICRAELWSHQAGLYWVVSLLS